MEEGLLLTRDGRRTWRFNCTINVDPGCLLDSKGAQHTLACVAWRFWLCALNKAGAGEEIGAGAASPLTVVLPRIKTT